MSLKLAIYGSLAAVILIAFLVQEFIEWRRNEMIAKDTLQAGALIFIILLTLGFVGNLDYEDAVTEERHYCASVKLFNDSNGQRGHPNFKELNCNESS